MAATGFHTADELNALLPGTLPGLLGIVIDTHEPGRLTSHLDVRPDLLAPNGYLHAGTVVTLADTSCGLPTRALLPEGSSGFTTLELKSNHLGTAREGRIAARLHLAPKTVSNHVSAILTKLQVADRTQAVVAAREAGLGRPT